jgi:hypothetical protein
MQDASSIVGWLRLVTTIPLGALSDAPWAMLPPSPASPCPVHTERARCSGAYPSPLQRMCSSDTVRSYIQSRTIRVAPQEHLLVLHNLSACHVLAKTNGGGILRTQRKSFAHATITGRICDDTGAAEHDGLDS